MGRLLALSCCFVTAANCQYVVADAFNGIEFASGKPSFVDKVLRYDPHQGGAAPAAGRNDTKVLGPPDARFMSLGRGGVIELAFTGHILTNSGDDSPDLYIGEATGTPEHVFVSLRPDLNTMNVLGTPPDSNGDGFLEIGRFVASRHVNSQGSVLLIDVDEHFPGFAPATLKFDAVHVADDPDRGETVGSTVGMDLESVGAISAALQDGFELCDSCRRFVGHSNLRIDLQLTDTSRGITLGMELKPRATIDVLLNEHEDAILFQRVAVGLDDTRWQRDGALTLTTGLGQSLSLDDVFVDLDSLRLLINESDWLPLSSLTDQRLSYPQFLIAVPDEFDIDGDIGFLVRGSEEHHPFRVTMHRGSTTPSTMGGILQTEQWPNQVTALEVTESQSFSAQDQIRITTNDAEITFTDVTATVLWDEPINLSYHPWLPGDVDKDGVFDRQDVVMMLQNGKYGLGIASWEDGDFNIDAVFDEKDVVAALQTASFLQGPYLAARAVPEPQTRALLIVGSLALGAVAFSLRQTDGTPGQLTS